MFGKIIESTVLASVLKYQHLTALAPTTTSDHLLDAKDHLLDVKESKADHQTETTDTMAASAVKFKSVWSTLFRDQNSCLVAKSMKASIDNTDTSSSTGSASGTSSSDYQLRRQKNNESVRKSRAKNRNKVQECTTHVDALHSEHVQLSKTLDNLETELYTLKGLFQHCFSFNLNNLALKPAEIPTSTLYKMIMKTEVASPIDYSASLSTSMPSSPSSTTSSMLSDLSEANLKLSEEKLQAALQKGTFDSTSPLNEVDNFYINQIKLALSNLVESDRNGNAQIRQRSTSETSETSEPTEKIIRLVHQ